MSGRLEDRLKELGRLPALAPPATLEERTLAAMAEAAAPRRTFVPARAAVWIAAAGAAVMLGAMVLERELGSGSEPDERVSNVGSESTTESGDQATAPAETADDAAQAYTQLAAEAAYLEQVLAAMPQRSVMRVSTAGTIAGLEDQLSVLDAELGRAASPEYRKLLMQNRVEVMNALVNVRYSQSTAFAY